MSEESMGTKQDHRVSQITLMNHFKYSSYLFMCFCVCVSQLSRASSLGQAGAARGSVKPVAAVLRPESGKIILPASTPGERIQEQDSHSCLEGYVSSISKK